MLCGTRKITSLDSAVYIGVRFYIPFFVYEDVGKKTLK
jgi:hypothetical protein